jgi:uncharacterized protein YbjT (DUF2867 family)
MSSPILVTGATGTLGRLLVRELLAHGREVRAFSRKPNPGAPEGQSTSGTAAQPGEPEWFVGDLQTGIGLAAALDGVTTVAHCATSPRGEAQMGAQLMIAAARAGRPHIVFPSVVGAETIRSRYYRDKRAVERLLEDGDLPWTVLRTTHFHEFIDAGLQMQSRFPVMLLSKNEKFQPVAADEVAYRLVDLCSGLQGHHMPLFGGPEILTTTELATAWLYEHKRSRKLLLVNKRGGEHDGWRAGSHLAPDRAVGDQTFAEYLIAQRETRIARDASTKADKVAQREAAKQAAAEAKAADRAARDAERAARDAEREAAKEQQQRNAGPGPTGGPAPKAG